VCATIGSGSSSFTSIESDDTSCRQCRYNSIWEQRQFQTPPSENLDADHEDDAPLRYRKLTDILGPSTPLCQAARTNVEYLLLASEEEPTTFKQDE
jgi:hypothetical protein